MVSDMCEPTPKRSDPVPRLFVGGPWHGQIEKVPGDLWTYRVARARGITTYHLATCTLGDERGLRVFAVDHPLQDPFKLVDALAIAAGLLPLKP